MLVLKSAIFIFCFLFVLIFVSVFFFVPSYRLFEHF